MKQIGESNPLAHRVDALKAELKNADLAELARRTGCPYQHHTPGSGAFLFSLWGRLVSLTYPDFRLMGSEGQEGNPPTELPTYSQALVLYYFSTCDGAPVTGKWISFTELPGGRFYTRAFQGYTGQEIARKFREDLEGFRWAAEVLGGRPVELGSAAYEFQVLPKVPILVVYWQGDEDFPSSCQILFDAAVSRHLPTDACAIMGSTLTRWLIRGSSA